MYVHYTVQPYSYDDVRTPFYVYTSNMFTPKVLGSSSNHLIPFIPATRIDGGMMMAKPSGWDTSAPIIAFPTHETKMEVTTTDPLQSLPPSILILIDIVMSSLISYVTFYDTPPAAAKSPASPNCPCSSSGFSPPLFSTHTLVSLYPSANNFSKTSSLAGSKAHLNNCTQPE